MRGSVFQEVAKEKEAEVSVAKTEDSALAARDSTEELESRETLAVSLISSCPLIPASLATIRISQGDGVHRFTCQLGRAVEHGLDPDEERIPENPPHVGGERRYVVDRPPHCC